MKIFQTRIAYFTFVVLLGTTIKATGSQEEHTAKAYVSFKSDSPTLFKALSIAPLYSPVSQKDRIALLHNPNILLRIAVEYGMLSGGSGRTGLPKDLSSKDISKRINLRFNEENLLYELEVKGQSLADAEKLLQVVIKVYRAVCEEKVKEEFENIRNQIDDAISLLVNQLAELPAEGEKKSSEKDRSSIIKQSRKRAYEEILFQLQRTSIALSLSKDKMSTNGWYPTIIMSLNEKEE